MTPPERMKITVLASIGVVDFQISLIMEIPGTPALSCSPNTEFAEGLQNSALRDRERNALCVLVSPSRRC
jgi:hypothetical protein